MKQTVTGKFRVQIRRKGFSFDQLFDTQEQATTARKEQLAKLESKGKKADQSLNEVAELYKQSSMFADKKASTQSTELGRINTVLSKLGKYTLHEIEQDFSIVLNYRDDRLKAKHHKTGDRLSKDAVRLELAAVSSLFNYAIEQRWIGRNPLHGMKRPRGEKRRRRVAKEEQLNLYLHANGKVEPQGEYCRFLLVQRDLGCRPGELAGLLADDIRLADSELIFRDTKDKRKWRSCVIMESAKSLLVAQLKHRSDTYPTSPYVFSTYRRAKQAYGSFNWAHAVARLKELGIVGDDYHAHANRREYVSRALERGQLTDDLMAQTGISTYATVQTYNEGISVNTERKERLRKVIIEQDKERLGELLENLSAYDPAEREIVLKWLEQFTSPPPKKHWEK